jgi:hypothetical protein
LQAMRSKVVLPLVRTVRPSRLKVKLGHVPAGAAIEPWTSTSACTGACGSLLILICRTRVLPFANRDPSTSTNCSALNLLREVLKRVSPLAALSSPLRRFPDPSLIERPGGAQDRLARARCLTHSVSRLNNFRQFLRGYQKLGLAGGIFLGRLLPLLGCATLASALYAWSPSPRTTSNPSPPVLTPAATLRDDRA